MNAELKAMFQEEARRIVSRDRSARKNGYSNNLSGEITTAIITAYKLGIEHGRNPTCEKPQLFSSDEALAWELIPPTSRNVLSHLTFDYSRRGKEPTFTPDELQGYIDQTTGRQRWLCVDQEGKPSLAGHSFAGKGIGPLRRLELLALKDGHEERFVLTSRGDATCRLYWARDDRNDLTLPVQSLR